MRISRRPSRRTSLLLFILCALNACGRDPQPRADANPDRLLVLVFDQMRPDYIDRFGLRNFQALRASARHYPDAYVGHLGSQTVVSHRSPAQRPALAGRRHGGPGRTHWQARRRVRCRQAIASTALATPRGATEGGLAARQGATHDGPEGFAIGEKDYATFLLGTPVSDGIVTMEKATGACRSVGVNVPDYIASNPRFAVDCREPYGTGLSTLYSLDSNRYVAGRDPAHTGGDVWTAVALEIMAREPWGAMFLTFGGIDKVAHMLGEQDGEGLNSVDSGYRLADVVRVADEQLGRLLDALRQRDLLERTVIVVTSDHGGQRNSQYLGNNKYQSCCPLENGDAAFQPPYWIEHLTHVGRLHTSYQDTSIKVWLADLSAENEHAVVRGLADISGMVDV